MRSNIVRLSQIDSVSDLINQMDRLNSIKEAQEDMLKETLEKLSNSLQPDVLFKKALHTFSEDTELKQDTFKTTLNLGAQFLLDKIMFRKGIGLKSYFLNIALKKVASFLITKSTTSSAGR